MLWLLNSLLCNSGATLRISFSRWYSNVFWYNCSVLVLLDLSSAFNCVEAKRSSQHVRHGIRLVFILFTVSIFLCLIPLHCLIVSRRAQFWGPCGSLFLFCASHGTDHIIVHYLFADDIQLCLSFKPTEAYRLSRLLYCLTNIRNWIVETFFIA